MTALFAALVLAQIQPRDDGAKDASFVAFRDKLRSAVAMKDARKLLNCLDERIEFSFDGVAGRREFSKEWGLSDPRSTPIWSALKPIVAFGSVRIDKGFEAPYYSALWPEEVDAFDHMVTLKAKTKLVEQPGGPVIGTLRFEIVKIRKTPEDGASWVAVTSAKGKSGFVKAEDLGSAVGYRAGFEKRNGAWKVTYFLAGD